MPSPSSPFDQVTLPAQVVVLTAQGCPHCSHVVQELKRLDRACPLVSVTVLDLEAALHLRERFGVRSVPAVIVDDDLCLEGRVTAEEVGALLAARGAPGFEALRCRAILEHGRVADAAIRLGTVEAAAAIASLLEAPELSMRMGAQLAVRDAFERDELSVRALLPRLLPLVERPDPAVRGDVADLLGAVGDASVATALRALLHDDHDDVREAAQDALAALERRGISCS